MGEETSKPQEYHHPTVMIPTVVDTSTLLPPNVSSEHAVSYLIRKGLFERGLIQVGVGCIVGGMTSIVVARSGGARKAITAFGTGVGIGSAWTRTSIDLEELLQQNVSK